MRHKLDLVGKYTWEVFQPRWKDVAHFSRDPSNWDLVEFTEAENGIVTVGINDMFLQYFLAGTGVTPALGLIDADTYVSVSDLDRMDNHNNWDEATTYDEATRPAWGPDTPSSATITNSSKALFTMNASTNVRGLFNASDNTKGGAGGILWSTAIFALVSSVSPGQVARAGYSLSGVGA